MSMTLAGNPGVILKLKRVAVWVLHSEVQSIKTVISAFHIFATSGYFG